LPHIETPPVSASLARSQVSEYLAEHHLRKFGDEFRPEDSLPIRLCIRHSPFVTCITQRAVITIMHLTRATRSGTTQRQVGVTSQTQGGKEQESEEQESKAQEGAEREYGAELENGDVDMDVEGDDDEGTDRKRRG
jgi:hypothetical protein